MNQSISLSFFGQYPDFYSKKIQSELSHSEKFRP